VAQLPDANTLPLEPATPQDVGPQPASFVGLWTMVADSAVQVPPDDNILAFPNGTWIVLSGWTPIEWSATVDLVTNGYDAGTLTLTAQGVSKVYAYTFSSCGPPSVPSDGQCMTLRPAMTETTIIWWHEGAAY